MREFDFWGSWDDAFAIVAAILGTGKTTIFVDKPYAEPRAQFFDKLTPELQELARTQSKLYLWLPGISDSIPIQFARWDSGLYAGQYYVTGRGPYPELVLPACYEEGPEGPRPATGTGGLIRLGVGTLSCGHEFYLPNPGVVVKMPRAAQEIDEEFRKIIKAHCKRFGPKKRWVGQHAITLLQEGKAEVVSPGYFK
jgi:hypothetical protein